jgi:SSS family solute:Na+ symporter
MNPALAILALFLVLSFALGLLARRGRTMTLEQWSVGGRGFGAVFVFLLMAGEIYTTFTFLGGSGWAYGRGAPAFYILCYGAIAYSISYFLLPVIWRYATTHQLHSQADFFVQKYRSPALGVIVSLVGVAALIPYLVLQLKGLGIIVSETSYGALSVPVAVWISVTALVVYVVISGVHGSAWTAVVKDIMILAVAVALGLYLPWRFYGGIAPMFDAIEKAKPGFLALPAKGMSVSWFVSTVLLTSLGFYMWPHAFSSAYTAKSEHVFRKNAAVMPLYQLVLLFVFFTGFAAILQVPGLTGAQADLSLLKVSKLAFPPLVVGWIGAAGLLTALVPGSMILMTAATILAKNVYRPLVREASEATVSRLARALVPVVALVAVYFTLNGGEAIVPLLLLGYNFVTQLFPSLMLSLPEKPLATPAGVMAGIVTGVATVAWTSLSGVTLAKLFPTWPSVITDLNVGIVAMLANIVVLVVVSALTRSRSRAALAAVALVVGLAGLALAPAARAESSALPLADDPAGGEVPEPDPSEASVLPGKTGPAPAVTPLFAPVPFKNTQLGWGLFVLAGAIHRFDPDTAYKPSTGVVGGFYTENKSWGLMAIENARLRHDAFRVRGLFSHCDVRYDFFGVGEDAGTAGRSVEIDQTMDFAIGTALARVRPNVYVGPAIMWMQSSIDPQFQLPPGVDAPAGDVRRTTLVAPGLQAERDTRDDDYWPTHGSVAKLKGWFYLDDLGGSREFQRYFASWSRYDGLRGQRLVLAVNALATTVTGDAPFYTLPSVGAGAYSLRGYQQGRYRDKVMITAQAEARYHSDGRFGATVFGGFGQVAPKVSKLPDALVLPAGGLGMRIQLTRNYPMHMRLDYAWGRDGGLLYFSVAEAF